MEIFFASLATLQRFSVFIHLCKANCAIGIIFQVNILLLFGIIFLLHSWSESIGQLIIQNFVGGFGNFGWIVKIVQNLNILGHLSNNEIDVFAGFLFHSEIDASTFEARVMDVNSIVRSWGSLNEKTPRIVFLSFSFQKVNFLILTSGNSWKLLIIFIEILFWLWGLLLLFLFGLFLLNFGVLSLWLFLLFFVDFLFLFVIFSLYFGAWFWLCSFRL